MASKRARPSLIIAVVLAVGCASAEDRLAEGVTLQTQGRYIEAVYRYVDALRRDATLVEAQDRLMAAGDSAVVQAMDDADQMELRGDPVAAAVLYRQVDGMLAAGREVGVRIPIPADYSAIRRGVFDQAINWQMVRGDEAAADGRWAQARDFYFGARGDYLPSREQVEESLEAEERVLLDWAEVELSDLSPRNAHMLAQEAIELRPSPPRETVLRVRELQDRALTAGTVVVAVTPVVADDGVRDYLGGEFEIALDERLALDHWTRPPLFVEIADPLILRRELRGLLRGQLVQSPILVGRALDLIGADLGVMIRLNEIEVTETRVDRDNHDAVVPRNVGGRGDPRRAEAGAPMDTVTYATVSGTLNYYVKADIVLVDTGGRELTRFEASSRRTGPFQRGEFDGDPRVLQLDERRAPFFDPTVLSEQRGRIEAELLDELAGAIAVGAYDQVLSGIR